MDRTESHVRVTKNGIEDWLPKATWKSIGEQENKDGWILIQNTPPEAIEIKMKSKEVAQQVVVEEIEIPVEKKQQKKVKA